jgi:hypothetical protein
VITVLADEVVVDAAPTEVLDHLADPRSYIGLSPLVVRVEVLGTDDEGTDYLAVERFGRGILHWDNRIRVRLVADREHLVLRSAVRSPGRVTLDVEVALLPNDAGTLVQETIRLSSPRVVAGFVRGQARAVQVHRLAELARRMAR